MHSRVTSIPAGIDCPGRCAATFADGANVTLHVEPDSTGRYRFSFWSVSPGAPDCGAGPDCALTIKSDLPLSLRYEYLPQKLHVAVSGRGNVISVPGKIDCGSTCEAELTQESKVVLAARPDAGWRFSGYSGACSGEVCGLQIDGAMSVTATFVPADPPPPASCAGLMPAAVPRPTLATMPSSGCWDTTSDGQGNIVLSYIQDMQFGPPYFNHRFFHVHDGQPASVGDGFGWGDEVGGQVFPQASGFEVVTVSGDNGSAWLESFSHEGVLTGRVALSPAAQYQSMAATADPFGGVATARFYQRAKGDFAFLYRHFGPAADLDASAEYPMGTELYYASAAQTNFARNVLVIAWGPGANLFPVTGRWLRADGASITDWFQADPGINRFQPLLDGTIAASLAGRWQRAYGDKQKVSTAAPVWLQQRADNRLWIVRGGSAYAGAGPSGPCGDAVEILDSAGASCGCVPIPGGSRASIGADGTVIVPDDVKDQNCSYRLYQQLLK